VLERSPKSYDQRLELAEGTSPQGFYSSPLYICRVVLLLLRQRRGAGLGELQRAHRESKYFATAPAHTQLSRAPPAFPVSRVKL
jgi:hypothetical protein